MSRHDLRKISGEIRNFISDAKQPPGGFMPGEETLTELLLVRLKQLLPRTSIVEKPTRHQEAREGHDFVWTVRTRHGYGTMRVQAKKLYDSGRYDQLNHHSGNIQDGTVELQLERLIRVAKNLKHAPIYAFYNGNFGEFQEKTITLGGCCQSPLQRTNQSSKNYSPMGVTLVDAHWVKCKMRSDNGSIPLVPKTKILNKAAMPWECLLFCSSLKSSTVPGFSGLDEQWDSNSFLRKLRNLLQVGQSGISERSNIDSGFSLEVPEWIEKLENSGIGDIGEWQGSWEDVRISYDSLESSLEGADRPDFYVYSDVRELD